MMLPVTGTFYHIGKPAQPEGKWQLKKDDVKEKKEELTPEMRQLQQYQEDMAKIREGNQMSFIDNKLKSGAELTPDEMEYLKKNNPDAYREYEEVKREKEAYKNQLKNCKTKEDTEKLKMTKMGSFMAEAKSISQNPNIPKAKKLKLMEKLLKKTLNVQQIHTEFTKSQRYQNLPTEEEKREAKKREEKVSEEFVQLKADYTEPSDESSSEDSERIEPGKTTATFEETQDVIKDYLIANRETGRALEYRETGENLYEREKRGNHILSYL